MWGAWIETGTINREQFRPARRSPCGERGLKLNDEKVEWLLMLSLPVWGAWIETATKANRGTGGSRRSPCGERGLKHLTAYGSLGIFGVAPRVGSVD